LAAVSVPEDFIIATKREAISASSTLEREVNYLLDKGYKWSENARRLVPK
jgi:hypothetical protein